MNTLSQNIKSAVAECPMVVGGKKLSKDKAEEQIWKLLADERIGVSKNDPDTHSLLNPSFISERDLRTVFCDEGKFAVPSIRCLMKHLLVKGSQESSGETGGIAEAIANVFDANKPVGQLKTKELLEKYDADAPQEIWDELAKRSKGHACVVFSGDGTVAVQKSSQIIKGIRRGEVSESNVYHDADGVFRLYSVGVFPEDTSLCCPITGKILTNGYCSTLGINWSGVSEDCLVFLRVVRNENKSETIGKFAAKGLLKAANQGLDALRDEYPEEALVYDDLKAINQLPSLRVSRNSLVAGRRVERNSDPFGKARRS